jgi:hypothetical protein
MRKIIVLVVISISIYVDTFSNSKDSILTDESHFSLDFTFGATIPHDENLHPNIFRTINFETRYKLHENIELGAFIQNSKLKYYWGDDWNDIEPKFSDGIFNVYSIMSKFWVIRKEGVFFRPFIAYGFGVASINGNDIVDYEGDHILYEKGKSELNFAYAINLGIYMGYLKFSFGYFNYGNYSFDFVNYDLEAHSYNLNIGFYIPF